jgi:hypothetical protein
MIFKAVDDEFVPLQELVSACIKLGAKAGEIIREVQGKGAIGALSKGGQGAPSEVETKDLDLLPPSEALTIADSRAQDVILSSLR